MTEITNINPSSGVRMVASAVARKRTPQAVFVTHLGVRCVRASEATDAQLLDHHCLGVFDPQSGTLLEDINQSMQGG